jgi:hypothetical protein
MPALSKHKQAHKTIPTFHTIARFATKVSPTEVAKVVM